MGTSGLTFRNTVTILPGTAWAIGTHLGTCTDVRDKLGANPQHGQDRPTCVIVLKHRATRAWVLGGVLGAAGVGAGIALAVLRLFSE